jgi:glutathione S-transferase
MRARMALAYAGISFEVREVILKDMPRELLAISPKGTVPVLQITESEILEESMDIMHWALLASDPDGWIDFEVDELDEMNELVEINDHSFKEDLDKYKYADRFPEKSQEEYREDCRIFLDGLEERLHNNRFLFADRVSFADFAIFPFVRQFSRVEPEWFNSSRYIYLRSWLAYHEKNPLFISIMHKYVSWKPGDQPVIFHPA